MQGLSFKLHPIFNFAQAPSKNVNFINILRTNFSYERLFLLLRFGFVKKIRTKNLYVKRWWNWAQVSSRAGAFVLGIQLRKGYVTNPIKFHY